MSPRRPAAGLHRRVDLAAALGLAVVVLMTAPTRVRAEAAATATVAAKKDQRLAEKASRPARARRRSPRPVGAPPPRLVNLYNTWTHEHLAVAAEKPAVPLPVVDRFLRCHFTNQPTDMADQLLGTVIAAANHFSADSIEVVSGFRHPKYNLMLRKKGHEVARDSQHTHGTAIDFRLPGVATDVLHRWAIGRRLGGVGLYKDSGFIHMDTEPIRTWGGT